MPRSCVGGQRRRCCVGRAVLPDHHDVWASRRRRRSHWVEAPTSRRRGGPRRPAVDGRARHRDAFAGKTPSADPLCFLRCSGIRRRRKSSIPRAAYSWMRRPPRHGCDQRGPAPPALRPTPSRDVSVDLQIRCLAVVPVARAARPTKNKSWPDRSIRWAATRPVPLDCLSSRPSTVVR